MIEIPRLTSTWAQAKTADALQKITKTLIAFVRYGHGEETIDEDGEESLDDQLERQRRAAARIAGKE